MCRSYRLPRGALGCDRGNYALSPCSDLAGRLGSHCPGAVRQDAFASDSPWQNRPRYLLGRLQIGNAGPHLSTGEFVERFAGPMMHNSCADPGRIGGRGLNFRFAGRARCPLIHLSTQPFARASRDRPGVARPLRNSRKICPAAGEQDEASPVLKVHNRRGSRRRVADRIGSLVARQSAGAPGGAPHRVREWPQQSRHSRRRHQRSSTRRPGTATTG
jgi:hypothetical protein